MTELPVRIEYQPPAQEPLVDPVAVYRAGLGSEVSRRSALVALRAISAIVTGSRDDVARIPWGELRYEHTQGIRAALIARYKPGSANYYLAVLRGVLKEAWRLGQISTDDYSRAVDLKSVRGESLLRGRALASGEIRALFEGCAYDPTPAGRRDAAIIAIAYGAMLRRAEIVALELTDFDAATGGLTIRSGKGNKDRLVFITNGSLDALNAWLEVRGAEAGPLFMPINKGGTVQHSTMTAQAIYNLLRKRGTQAGVKDFSPHDMRRSGISELLDHVDIATVSKIAGHSSPTVTAKYDRRDDRAKQRAAEALHVPFVRHAS